MKGSPHITFINPPGLYSPKSLSYWGPTPPLGLAYIIAIAKKMKFLVHTIDAVGQKIDHYQNWKTNSGPLVLNGLNIEEIVEQVNPKTHLIAISHLFLHQWPFINQLTLAIKKRTPNALIILGGENASSFRDYILENAPQIDFCVQGEGEKIFSNVLINLKENKNIKDLPGLSYFENGKLIDNPKESRIAQVENIPWPAWEEFPIENYLKSKDGMGYHKGRSLPIMATRGCPYHCTFCSAPDLWTNKYFLRGPQDVLKEIKYLKSQYNIQNFNFSDLTLIANINWIRDFCSLLKKENLNITWQLPSGTRSEVLRPEILKMMKQTGLHNLNLSPESGSIKIIKAIKKRVKLSKFQEVQRSAQRAGIKTEANIIIGHPKETRKDLLKTLWFILKLSISGLNDISPIIFTPYPGSEDYRRLKEEGKIVFDENYFYSNINRVGNATLSYHPSIGIKELVFYQFFILFTFYGINYLIRPIRIIKVVKNLFEPTSNGQMESFLKKRLTRVLEINPLDRYRSQN